MLNETKKAHIKGQVVKSIGLRTAGEVVALQVAIREDTEGKLERQLQKEHEEIEYLKSLNLAELTEEAGR